MIITISGMPGSGKSTVGKLLAKKLDYRFYSMGDLRGKMAMERGITIDELNELGKTEAWTDRDADEYQKKLGGAEDNFIIDGRLSFHFIPHSFKIFLDVLPQVGAERIFKDNRPDEWRARTVEAAEQMIANRVASDDERYQKYYDVSFRDMTKFDLVIDTSKTPPEIILDRILAALPNPTSNRA